MPDIRVPVPPQPHASLTYHAKLAGKTIPQLVNEILNGWLAKQSKKGPSDVQPQE